MPESKSSDLIEYHGWAVLYCRFKDWSDEEWNAAREDVEKAVKELRQEDGHAIHMDWPANGGSVVAINGWATCSTVALELLQVIGKAAPHSYGELLVIKSDEPTSDQMIRYTMREGVIKQHPNGLNEVAIKP